MLHFKLRKKFSEAATLGLWRHWLKNTPVFHLKFDCVWLNKKFGNRTFDKFDWQIFWWVWLCSITERNQNQSNDWRSIEFDYITERSISYAG